MSESDFSIWDEKTNKLVRKIWTERQNYEVCINNNDDRRCFIFFSSHGVYCPNTEEDFYNTIVVKDRYEWRGVCKHRKFDQRIGKIIYIRDVFKMWYVTGINQEYDSLDKVIELLLKETSGYDVYTVGNSGGGYAAIIAGIKLNAKGIYSFSGQFTITDQLEWAPLLNQYKEDITKSQYYDLDKYIENSDSPIYHFFPVDAEYDLSQYNYIKNRFDNIYCFAFNQKDHGNTVTPSNYTYLFECSRNKLIRYCNLYKERKINKWLFLINTAGKIKGTYEIVYKVFFAFCKRMKRKK